MKLQTIMTYFSRLIRPRAFAFVLAAGALLGLGVYSPASAQDQRSASKADQAWQKVVEAAHPPEVPDEWQTTRPTEEEIAEFRSQEGKRAAEAARLARDFSAAHPNDPRAEEAKAKEYEMLELAAMLGDRSQEKRLAELEAAKLRAPGLTEDERFEMRFKQVQREAMAREDEGEQAVMAAFEKGARDLQKEFPKRPELYAVLLQIAANSDDEKAVRIAKEIAASDAPEALKQQAESLVKKSNLLGNPVPIQFTSLKGKEIDLTDMKGKVVLVDFWATWCGPCVAELPNVKAAYEKLHPKGFEIVGISFDQSRSKLEQFIKQNEMPWPQYFDGEGWGNKIGQAYGINSIPTMWLIGKDGKVRDLNARSNLAAKVEKLLAE